MNDPHRLGPNPPSVSTRRGGGTVPRTLLWVVLIVSATINVIGGNVDGGNKLLGAGAGILTVGCIAGLIAYHFTQRDS